MDDRGKRLEALYHKALELAEEERHDFLTRACGEDQELRRDVASLLRYDDSTIDASGFYPTQGVLSGTIGNRFRVRRRLGSGGMGEVYLADDTKLKTQVALKRLAPSLQRDPSYRKLLEREAQKAAQLRDSPHVATLHEIFDTEQGETFLVMEYVEGNSLRYWVREPVSLDAFVDVAIQCLQGVEEAHRKRIIHRDIKPENIIVRSDGQVKICDFGVAKRLRVEETDQGSAVNTQPYQSEGRTFADGIAGTPAYMAPEAWELPADDIDERADVFSLGAVFYEILAKQNPFRGSTLQETRDRVEHLVPYPLRDYNPRVPPRLDRIITRMLSKDRNDRYATAEEIR